MKHAVPDNYFTLFWGWLISAATYLLGGIDGLFIAFAIFLVSDFITGLLAALYTDKLNSRVAFWGAVRKGAMVVLIIISNQLDIISGSGEGYVRTAIILYLIGTEGISILENLAKLDLPVPPFLRGILDRFKNRTPEQGGGK